MNWSAIRFELARTPEFPDGSASRAYIVHLPLLEIGHIDPEALRRAPSKAIVRRFWPGEPDLVGFVIPTEGGWAFSYRDGSEDDESLFKLPAHRIAPGEYLTVHEPDGRELPYRITEVIPLTTRCHSQSRRQMRA